MTPALTRWGALGLMLSLVLLGCSSMDQKLVGEWTTDKSKSRVGDLGSQAESKFPSITIRERGGCHLMGVECSWKREGNEIFVSIPKGDKLLSGIGAAPGRKAGETKLTITNGGENLEWPLSRESGEPLHIVLKNNGLPHDH